MASLDIKIDYLGNHPHLAETLAQWSWAEWQPIYTERKQTFEHALKNYQERTNIDRLPLTLVAFHGDELIGTVSLKFHDLDTRPELDPWLGGVFVLPGWRGRGIASLLMQRAVTEASRLQLPKLYLWTSSAEGLYQKLGWKVVERSHYCGKDIALMDFNVADTSVSQWRPN